MQVVNESQREDLDSWIYRADGAVEVETGMAEFTQGIKALLDGVREGLLQSDLQREIKDGDECRLQIPCLRNEKGWAADEWDPGGSERKEREGAGRCD